MKIPYPSYCADTQVFLFIFLFNNISWKLYQNESEKKRRDELPSRDASAILWWKDRKKSWGQSPSMAIVSYTFYRNFLIFLHIYNCHISDILQLWKRVEAGLLQWQWVRTGNSRSHFPLFNPQSVRDTSVENWAPHQSCVRAFTLQTICSAFCQWPAKA